MKYIFFFIMSFSIFGNEVTTDVQKMSDDLKTINSNLESPSNQCANLTEQSLLSTDFVMEDVSKHFNSIYKSMCQQAQVVLSKIKKIDSTNNLHLECEAGERIEERKLFFLKNDLKFYRVTGKYSGGLNVKCPLSKKFNTFQVKTISTHIASDDGMPAGVNPYLKDMLAKLGVESEVIVIKEKVPGDPTTLPETAVQIKYPVCE